MIRIFITSFILSLLLTACVSERHNPEKDSNVNSVDELCAETVDSIVLAISGISNFTNGVDSLTIISANGNELFKIAEGGDLELLADTVVKMDAVNIGIVTLADYFQENQIFYVIYNPNDSVLLQSTRLYLPYIGMDVTQYKQLDSITLVGDSLSVKSHTRPEINLSLALDTLICNSDGIINYYEFE